MKFSTGQNPKTTDLTDAQILRAVQDVYRRACALRTSFGCDAIGIQYQQGLKDMAARVGSGRRAAEQCRASAVFAKPAGKGALRGRAVAALQRGRRVRRAWTRVITNRVLTAMQPGSRDHAARRSLGRALQGRGIDDFVWVLQISGAVPPSHIAGGYAKAQQRAPATDVLPLWAAAR